MGAYNLGGARPANSGYSGNLKGPDRDTFDNKYFKNILDPEVVWTNVVW